MSEQQQSIDISERSNSLEHLSWQHDKILKKKALKIGKLITAAATEFMTTFAIEVLGENASILPNPAMYIKNHDNENCQATTTTATTLTENKLCTSISENLASRL